MSGEHGATPADATAPRISGDLPSRDLADLWTMLDVLPRASSSVDMAATTVDMVAAAVAGSAGRRSALPRSGGAGGRPRWLLPMAAVCASLVAGVVAGRMSATDPDLRILEYLPLIRHIGILQEAGTTRFLKALADRRLPQPLRLPADVAREETREFDEAIRDLEADPLWGDAAQSLVKDRRQAIDTLSADERDALARAAATFQELPATDRRDLVAVATALADPRRENLRDAARAWHLLIAASDPADRKNIVALDEEGRLEWVDRRARLRDWERPDRRGLPQGGEGPIPLRGPAAGGLPGEGRPRWQGPRGEGGGPPGSRFEGRPRGEFGPRDGDGPRPGEPRPDAPPRERGPRIPEPPLAEPPPPDQPAGDAGSL